MFSKKQDASARPSGNGALANNSFSVLGPDIAIKGDLKATVDLHLDGRIEGDINCAALVQGESSEIVGSVLADSARIAGRIKGSVTADVLVVLKSARIDGDISYGSLTVEEGAQVNGKFTLRAAEPKLMLAGGTQAS